MNPGDTATVVDAWGRNPVTGKVVLVRQTGIAIDDARGVRIWATTDRIRDNSPAPARYHHDVFGPLMLDVEREILGI